MYKREEIMDDGDLIAQFLENQYIQERPAPLEDYAEPVAESYMVETNIVPRGAYWVVYLVLIDLAHPVAFARMPVKACQTQRLAEITAAYLRRAHSLDVTLAFHVDPDALNSCPN